MKASEFNKIIAKFALVMGIQQDITPEYCEVMTEALNQVGIDANQCKEILGRMSRDLEYKHYNRLPALPEFRQYHAASNPQIGEMSHRAELLAWVSMYCDTNAYFPMEQFNEFATKRDWLAIAAAGGLDGIYRAANSKYSNLASQCKKLGEIWDSISTEDKVLVKIGIMKPGGMLTMHDLFKQITGAK